MNTTNHPNQDKLKKAIDYLRERNIYLVDRNTKFVPTCAAGTNVCETWQRYLSQTKRMEDV
jgi:hypothetical protein